MKSTQLLALIALTLTGIQTTLGAAASSQAATQPDQAFGKTQLAFEANVGQTDPQVKFLARGNGYTAFLTSDGAVLKLTKRTRGEAPPASGEGVAPELGKIETISAVVRMRLVGLSEAPKISTDGLMPSRVSYISGSNAARQPALFGRVSYSGLWPGVSMVYYGSQRQLEYDFTVAPGASPAAIRLAFDGVSDIHVDAQGALVLTTDIGELRQPAPVIYQENGGARTAIQGGYLLLADRQVGFQVATYDTSKPLVIDPSLAFAASWGGSGQDYAEAIAVDKRTGEIVVAGYTDSTDFPGYNQGPDPTRSDMFVSKLSPDGTRLLFSTVLGGTFDEDARGIAIDGSGNIYLTGQTQSSDFPRFGYPVPVSPRPHFVIQPSRIAPDLFVVKLNGSGEVQFCNRFGGSNDDYGNAIAVSKSGTVYVTGRTYSPDFPVVVDSNSYGNKRLSGESDAFLFVLTIQPGNGETVVTSFYFGGAGDESAKSIAVVEYNPPYHGQGTYYDADIFIGGWTSSLSLPTTNGAFQRAYQGGSSDGFVAKFSLYDVVGIAPQFSYSYLNLGYLTFVGGEYDDAVYGIYVDPSGILHATGYTRSRHFPVTYDAFQTRYGGGDADAFVVKLGRTGAVQFSTYFGGSGDDFGRAIVVDDYDRPYIVGYTDSWDLPTTRDAFQTDWAGGWDIFAAIFENDGRNLAYSSYFGLWNDEFAYCAARDSYGNLYIGGSTNSTYSGDTDVLALKLQLY